MAMRRKGSDDRQLGLDAFWTQAPKAPSPSASETPVPAVPQASPPAPASVPASSGPLQVGSPHVSLGGSSDGRQVGSPSVALGGPSAGTPRSSEDGPPDGPTVLEVPNGEAPGPAVLQLPEALRLERNLSLAAGAGTGKTYSLVTMCLHLIGGARRGFAPVECGRLGLLTFTDKAAGEMRERLRARLDALAEGRGHEPELEASFERLGAPVPPRRFWREARDALGAATVGTFHSLCSQLLRRAPASAGVNPGFVLLDEREAGALLAEVVERVVLRRVQAGSREVRHLVSEFGFGGRGGSGLVDALVPVSARLREEGLSPRFVQVADGVRLRQQYEAALAELRGLAGRAVVEASQHRDRLVDFARTLEQLTFERTPELVPRLRDTLGKVQQGAVSALRAYVRQPKRGEGGWEKNLQYLHGACVMAPHEAVVRDVLTDIEEEHATLLDRRGALDFTGLLVRAKDLLRDSLEARAAAQERLGALLVDEFQDTNRLQLELVLLLSERREGGPRPVSTAFETQHQEILQVPIEPGFLAVVGDRKQSIYEFRGADVSVFATMTRAIERGGGARAFLQASRRASPALARALNAVMTRVLTQTPLGGARRDFDVGYAPEEDDLLAVRTEDPPGAPLVRLRAPERRAGDPTCGERSSRCAGQAPSCAPHRAEQPSSGALGEAPTAEALRQADAEAVARYLAWLLADPSALVVPRGGEPRRPRGGDVAVLFQRFTQLEVYRQALVRHGVRHRVVRGRGLWGAQEVVDVASLLSLFANRDDAVAFAAVLRSPFVGLSDTALVELALGDATWAPRLRPSDVLLKGRRPVSAVGLERQRLERFVEAFVALEPVKERLGVRAVLQLMLERTGFEVALAASPFGEQALANLGKLLEEAASADERGASFAALAAELLALAEAEPAEAQGEVVDALDADAVTVCTVHQSKGLEWPVVVLPDLSAGSPAERSPVRFDRLAGLGVKPPATDEGELQSLSIERIAELKQARATAERLRLLYVAMTRARDRVVLGLEGPKARAGTWAADLSLAMGWADVREAVLEVEVDALPSLAPSADQDVNDADAAQREALRDDARRTLARVRTPHRLEAAQVMVSVTQLADFVGCPRRYHLVHQVGLRERRVGSEASVEALGAGAGAGEGRERGSAAHTLLELAPLGPGGPELLEALRAIRRHEGLEAQAGEDVLEWVGRFFASPFGRRLGALGEGRVHRELPFVLTAGAGGATRLALRGQIDLVVEEDEVLSVVDYKTSPVPPAGLAAHRFQLRCYALAATRLAGPGVPVRAGASFLRSPDPEPRFLTEPLALEALEGDLGEAARALVEAQRSGHWAQRSRGSCEAQGCGFVGRCHGAGPG